MKIEIAPHLTADEIACHCCGQSIAHIDLLNAWTYLRVTTFCKPITIVSGYRCPKHNKEVHGTRASAHMQGKAIDVRVTDPAWFDDSFIQVFAACGFHGVGRNRESNFIHLDTKDRIAVWDYNGYRTRVNRVETAILKDAIRGLSNVKTH